MSKLFKVLSAADQDKLIAANNEKEKCETCDRMSHIENMHCDMEGDVSFCDICFRGMEREGMTYRNLTLTKENLQEWKTELKKYFSLVDYVPDYDKTKSDTAWLALYEGRTITEVYETENDEN